MIELPDWHGWAGMICLGMVCFGLLVLYHLLCLEMAKKFVMVLSGWVEGWIVSSVGQGD